MVDIAVGQTTVPNGDPGRAVGDDRASNRVVNVHALDHGRTRCLVGAVIVSLSDVYAALTHQLAAKRLCAFRNRGFVGKIVAIPGLVVEMLLSGSVILEISESSGFDPRFGRKTAERVFGG